MYYSYDGCDNNDIYNKDNNHRISNDYHIFCKKKS